MNFKVIFMAIFIGIAFQINAQNTIDNKFFNQTDAFFKKNVTNGLVKYDQLKSDKELSNLISQVAEANVDNLDKKSKQAFYINAYNLLVINAVAGKYPIKSVMEINGFFDKIKRRIAGENLTLNQLEKTRLLEVYNDARFHFVLVCGAKGCPPITNFAYTPAKLEQQLQQQTVKALNNPDFINVNAGKNSVGLSQIFNWYPSDFGGKSKVIDYINRFRKSKIGNNFKSNFYEYDWSLNKASDGMGMSKDIEKGKMTTSENTQTPTKTSGANAARYVVSAAIPKGTTETILFNNLYTQKTGTVEKLENRATFFTQSLSFLYGFTGRFNAGFDLRYRRVRNDNLPSSPFTVLTRNKEGQNRDGFTSVGPKIRWAPTSALSNFSLQSSFTFPIGKDLQGNIEEPYIDWDGATWNTQLFNDFSIGENFSLFTEVDILLEDIGKSSEGDLNRFSTPATVIFSYFPNSKTTIYTLGSYSPFWQENYDYFAQAGVGAKYQITRQLEVETLYTAFTNQFLKQTGGQASTFNIGIRYSR